MVKHSKNTRKVSDKTKEEALAIARGTQKPGQTKEQTKLIAQGIQKGIEQYKKQYKAKVRELDKKSKQAERVKQSEALAEEGKAVGKSASHASARLPWLLLGISWVGFFGFLALNS